MHGNANCPSRILYYASDGRNSSHRKRGNLRQGRPCSSHRYEPGSSGHYYREQWRNQPNKSKSVRDLYDYLHGNTVDSDGRKADLREK
jgi:hypothetical protein